MLLAKLAAPAAAAVLLVSTMGACGQAPTRRSEPGTLNSTADCQQLTVSHMDYISGSRGAESWRAALASQVHGGDSVHLVNRAKGEVVGAVVDSDGRLRFRAWVRATANGWLVDSERRCR